MTRPAMSKKRFLEKCDALGVTDPNKIVGGFQTRFGSTKLIQFSVPYKFPVVVGRSIQTVHRRWGNETDAEYACRVEELMDKYKSWLIEHLVEKEGNRE